MAAMTGAERSKKLRDEEKAKGIEKLIMKLTATERGWIQQAQDIGGYEDHTELLLQLAREYIKSKEETQIVARNDEVNNDASKHC